MSTNENEIDELKDIENTNIITETNNNFNASKDVNKVGVVDIESSHSEGSKTIESREERIKRLKEQTEIERQRKMAEIIESQKLSQEVRQKQQIERRKKIEELKMREDERRKGVEQRKKELEEREKEKTESMQKRSKEREARAALSQKQAMRTMSTSMSQSMISPRNNRMTTSAISSGGASSGSEKCMKKTGYGRWPSSCDVDRVLTTSYGVSSSAGISRRVVDNNNNNCASRNNSSSHRRSKTNAISYAINTNNTADITSRKHKRLQPPEGFLEVDGHFIPASIRHAGCFLPYKGPRYHVRGVLAWGPPRDNGGLTANANDSHSTSGLAWWASINGNNNNNNNNATLTGAHKTHPRASSAHNSLVVDSHGFTRKEMLSPRATTNSTNTIKIQSASRFNNVSGSTTALSSNTNPTINKTPTMKKLKDDSIFDRLAKPRSGSQPPKINHKESFDEVAGKTMSSSFIKPAVKIEKIATKAKKKSVVAESTPSLNDGNLCDNEVVQSLQIVVNTPKEIDSAEMNISSIEDISSAKPGSRKNSKNFSKSPPSVENNESVSAGGNSSPALVEEMAYKTKLAEQRRIAREKKEEQLEEQRKIAEEAKQKAALEKKKMEEETRFLIEEGAKRTRLMEEERLSDLEKQRLLEEAEKKKKEDTERELEDIRLEKLRLAEEARMDRKKRLELIMTRVKNPTSEISTTSNDEMTNVSEIVDNVKNDGIMEMSLDESVLKQNDESVIKEESPQPTEAWITEDLAKYQSNIHEVLNDTYSTKEIEDINNQSLSNSPDLLSDTLLDLTGPQSQSQNSGKSQSSVPTKLVIENAPEQSQLVQPQSQQTQPVFKSKLLQSMLGSGRLNTGRAQDDRTVNLTSSSNPSLTDLKVKRNSLFISDTVDMGETSSTSDEAMPHSKSYQADLVHLVSNGMTCNQAINGLSYPSENSNVPTMVIVNGGDNHCQLDNNYNDNIIMSSDITNNDNNNNDNNIDPPRIAMDILEMRSESMCSQYSCDESPPTMPVHSSQALELS